MAEINEKETWAKLYQRALFEEDNSKCLCYWNRHTDLLKVRELCIRPPLARTTDKERHELNTRPTISISCGP